MYAKVFDLKGAGNREWRIQRWLFSISNTKTEIMSRSSAYDIDGSSYQVIDDRHV